MRKLPEMNTDPDGWPGEEDPLDGTWFLQPLNPSEKPIQYEPLEHTGLFEEFSELRITGYRDLRTRENQILNFADRYGPPADWVVVGGLRDGGSQVYQPYPWFESEAMYQVVSLWKAIESADEGRIARHPYFRRGPREPDTEAAARRTLVTALNARLHRVQPYIDTGEGFFRMRLHPNDLAAAMWLQVAEAVAQNRVLRRCEGCGRWFQVGSPEGERRADAKTCNNACRQKKKRYQQRKKLLAQQTEAT